MTVDQIRSLPGVIDTLATNHTNMEEVMGRARNFNIVRARHKITYIIYNSNTKLSEPMVGRIMNRDRSTIGYAVRKMHELQQHST